jgi:hypothetical protein
MLSVLMLSDLMLSVLMPSVLMLSVFMLSVFMLSVLMLSVVAPIFKKYLKILITTESGVSRHLHLGRFQSILIIFENALQNRKCKRTLSHFRQDFVLQIRPSPLETAEGGKVDLAGLKATMDSSKRVLHH